LHVRRVVAAREVLDMAGKAIRRRAREHIVGMARTARQRGVYFK
jgi:hypothetical protein